MNETRSEEIIAYCGLTCHSCPIFLATRESDTATQKKMREAIALLCREQYGMKLRSEDITDCDGCRSETGRLFSGCMKCEIRKCARQGKLESCARCADFACEKLERLFATEEGARARLEAMRASGWRDQ